MTTTKLSLISTSILTAFISSQANADMQSGKNWLSAQNANNTNNSTIANSLQTNQETAQTLQLLQTQLSNNTDISQLLDNETSTEGLVRIILLAHAEDSSSLQHQAWEQLKFNQNEDGGFAHIENWQSNPLDTAFFLLALHETDYLSSLNAESQTLWQSRINKALNYLALQQRDNGNYSIAHLDDLYTSSYVLSALTPYLTDYGQYIPVTQKLVGYLESQQTAPATWSSQTNNKGLFLDALVAESLYPYQSSDNSAQFSDAFEQRALSLQNADGSWQQDGYVTALVLRAMDGLSKPVVNPMTSAISLSVVDAETGLPLSGVELISKDSVQAVSASSNADGGFLIQDSKAGDYIFVLSKDGYAPVQLSLSLKRGQQLNLGQIKLSRADMVGNGQIQGKVTDDKGNAIAGATLTVTLTDEDGDTLNAEPIIVKTAGSGSYQVVLSDEQQQASEGYFTISASFDGYVPVNGSGQVPVGGVVQFNATLMNEGDFKASVTGQVVDEQGAPIAGAIIAQGSNTVISTDNEGRFTISGLTLGAQQWSIDKSGYHSAFMSVNAQSSQIYDAGIITLSKVQLSDPSDPNSEPVPQTMGHFTIGAVDATYNNRILGFDVTAEQLDEQGEVIRTLSFSSKDNSENTIAVYINNLPIGKWRLTVSHPSYESQSQTFELADGDKLEYLPELVLKPYVLSGTVVDSQTNLPIGNAPIKVIDEDTATPLYEGMADANGHFVLPDPISASNIRVEITPEDYLSTTRYVSREFETATNVDMGEIRLRPKSAQVVLPDLTITELDATGLSTDQQQLITQGKLIATIENKGDDKLTAGDVKVTAFIDLNGNRKLDEDEQVLATADVTESLAVAETATVELTIDDKVNFRDAPIAVMVDSEKQVAEKDEGNNVRLTSDANIKQKISGFEHKTNWNFTKGWNRDYSFNSITAAPLSDTNNNGKIGEGDIATIVFLSRYTVYAVNGKTGKEEWSYYLSGYSDTRDWKTSAIADVNNDGLPEVIVANGNGNLSILSNTGQLLKTYDITRGGRTDNIEVSNLDNIGEPEIIVNHHILRFSDGVVKDAGVYVRAVADLDGNGYPEIIGFAGERYEYATDKSFGKLGTIGIESVVANMNDDKHPELILSYPERLEIIDIKNQDKFSFKTNARGIPVIEDFDNDGVNDIGIPGCRNYDVYRADGSLLWSSPTHDLSSCGTTSTVYDLNGDGFKEVIYADEFYLRVLAGTDGHEIFKSEMTNGTSREYPIVLDADADGSADIFFVSSGSWKYHTQQRNPPHNNIYSGLHMISSVDGSWTNTRNIWNSYNYHITNINDDLGVPLIEENSWEAHNTYRVNIAETANTISPIKTDLTASYIQVDDRSFFGDSTLTARIGNAGGKTVPAGTPVSFYRIPKDSDKAELLQTVTLSKSLIAGNDEPSYEDLTIKYQGSLADFGELIVIANDAGAGIDSATGIPLNATEETQNSIIQEYSRSNNIARLAIDGGFVNLTLDSKVDNTAITANSDLTLTSVVSNLGSFPTSPIIKTDIIDSAGNVIATLPEQEVKLTSALIADPDNSKTLTQTWNTGTQPVGNYTIRTTLWKKPTLSTITGAEAELVAQVDTPFAIVTDGAKTGITNSSISTDKASYSSDDVITLNSRIQNTASNQIATKRDITVEVKDPDGEVVHSQTYSYEELPPNAIKDQPIQFNLTDAKAGTYTLTQTTTAPDGSQAEQVNRLSFAVTEANQAPTLTGSLTAPTETKIGNDLTFDWTVNNTGDTDLSDVPVRVVLLNGDSTDPFASLPVTNINLDSGVSITNQDSWTIAGAVGDTITAILVADLGDGEQGIAQTSFTLTKGDDDTGDGDPTDPEEPKVTANFDDPTSNDNTLLVYYGCNDGWNSYAYQQSNNCLENREATLRRYLDRQDIDYKLVNTASDFTKLMHSGIYEQYWIVGAKTALSEQTQAELSELSYSGDNLFTDASIYSWTYQGYDNTLGDIAGVTYINWLQLNNGNSAGDIVTLDDYMSQPTDPSVANTQLNTKLNDQYSYFSRFGLQLQATSNATQMWAGYGTNGYQHCSYYAIAGAEHGIGTPLTSSFDLLGSLAMATETANGDLSTVSNLEQHWDSVLSDILRPRAEQNNNSTNISDYVANDVVTIPLTLSNTGDKASTIQVDVTLPTGSEWLGYTGGTDNTLSTDTEQHYQITLKPQQTLNDVLTIRLPSTTGTHGVKVTVTDISHSTPIQIDSYEARFLVRDINTRTQLIVDTLNSWRIYNFDYYYLYYAKQSASNLQNYADSQYLDYSLQQAVYLAEQIDKISSVDEQKRRQLRLEVDEVIRALQIRQYHRQ